MSKFYLAVYHDHHKDHRQEKWYFRRSHLKKGILASESRLKSALNGVIWVARWSKKVFKSHKEAPSHSYFCGNEEVFFFKNFHCVRLNCVTVESLSSVFLCSLNQLCMIPIVWCIISVIKKKLRKNCACATCVDNCLNFVIFHSLRPAYQL